MIMKNKISLIISLVFGIVAISKSQSIPIQVINSAGGGGPVGTTGFEVYYNIGETVIATVSNTFATITQGFLQPDIVGKFGLSVIETNNNISCIGKLDGSITLTASVSGLWPPTAYAYSYYWEPSSLCPSNTCSTVAGLSPGTYSVLVVSVYTGSAAVPDDSVKVQNIIILDNSAPCLLEIFNGVTPNGDGNNDFFYIKNIEQYPDNVVDIYNRWGQQLAHIPGYNNIDKKWGGTINETQTLAPSGTYFYVIDLVKGSKKPLKGWIELLHK